MEQNNYNISYKQFINLSKYVVGFSKLKCFQKIFLYIKALFRKRKFKKTYKNEMKGKIVKKEV